MSYAIMRIQKLSHKNSFARVFNHNHRAYENSEGIDKEREHLNIIDGSITSYKDVRELLEYQDKRHNEITNKKARKDAVRGFEIIFASDVNFMLDEYNRNEYFKNAIEWTKEVFGEKNYLNSVIHLDENGAPHIHTTVLSVDETGRYNAKKWVNNRNSLVGLQDSWFDKNKYLGLERGKSVNETGNHHLTKKEYSKLLQKDLDTVRGLSELEKDLLAVKGLRAEKKANKAYEELKKKSELSKFINENLPDELEEEFEI